MQTMTQTTKSDNDSDTRARFIAVTADIIGQEGIEAATLKNISARADANHGLVAYYFGSKQNLLAEVALEASHRYLKVFRFAREGKHGVDALNAVFEAAARVAEFDRAQFRLMFELYPLALADPGVGMQVNHLLDIATKEVADLLTEAKDGVPGSSGGDREFGVIIRAAFDGIAFKAMLDPEFDFSAAVKTLQQLVLLGIGQSPPTKK